EDGAGLHALADAHERRRVRRRRGVEGADDGGYDVGEALARRRGGGLWRLLRGGGLGRGRGRGRWDRVLHGRDVGDGGHGAALDRQLVLARLQRHLADVGVLEDVEQALELPRLHLGSGPTEVLAGARVHPDDLALLDEQG